jgi:hypothetical protein
VTGPAYGYTHRARVLRAGGAAETYVVEIPTLAPGCAAGPFASTVRDLEPGDRVLLMQVGLTGGDLVIMGRLPERDPDVTLPINISDVTGLQAALDNRATDAELDAAEARLDAVETVNATQDTQLATADTRLDAVEATNSDQDTELAGLTSTTTSLDTRLDTAETTVSGHTTELSSHTNELATLQDFMRGIPAFDADIYGDLISPIGRYEATNFMTLTADTVYIVKLRARTAMTVGRIRWALGNTATGAGTMSGAAYTASSSAGPYTLLKNTNTVNATAIGIYSQAWSDASSPTITRGTWVLLAVRCSTGYTQTPRLSTQQNAVPAPAILHPSAGVINIGFKGSLTSFPATISPNDGTWSSLNLNFWAALAT